MNTDTIKDAEQEACLFLNAVSRWSAAQERAVYTYEGREYHRRTPVESGALYQAIMDLTRALARMRR